MAFFIHGGERSVEGLRWFGAPATIDPSCLSDTETGNTLRFLSSVSAPGDEAESGVGA